VSFFETLKYQLEIIYYLADTLKRVINGGSQNANESFHAVLWSFVPKSRLATGVVLDLCAAIAVLSYNDGNQSILPIIAELTGKNVYGFGLKYNIVSLLGGGCGFYTKVAMRRLDERRVYSEHKRKRIKQENSKLTNETFHSQQNDRMSLGDNDNPSDDSYISGAY
jgi:hypothetical protein